MSKRIPVNPRSPVTRQTGKRLGLDAQLNTLNQPKSPNHPQTAQIAPCDLEDLDVKARDLFSEVILQLTGNAPRAEYTQPKRHGNPGKIKALDPPVTALDRCDEEFTGPAPTPTITQSAPQLGGIPIQSIASSTVTSPGAPTFAEQQLERIRSPELIIPPLEAIQAEQARRSFRKFVELAWHVVEPACPFIPGWHIDAVCEHLQALSELVIRDLVISIPPRHAKSTLTAVLFPAWVWLTFPGKRWLFFSYAHGLSKRDSRRCRALIQSDWYQKRWGDVYRISKDSNTMLRFDNNHMGFRFSTSVNGMLTGEGGDFLVGDDLNNMKEIHSPVKRDNVITFWDEVVSSRVNNPQTGCRLVIAQRGHSRDLIGHILENDKGVGDWVNLLLPAEYEPKYHCTTSIGWTDPRKTEGELLWPARFGLKEIRKLKRSLGSYAYAAQYQQRPTPEDGGVFDPLWWRFYSPSQLPPVHLWTDSCISIDMSFGATTATASYVVAQAWCRVGSKFYLIDQIRGQWEYVRSKNEIKRFCQKHHNIFAILVEDKANGPAIMDDLAYGTDGTDGIPGIFPITPKGTKEARARAVSPIVEAHDVLLPEQKTLTVEAQEWLGELLLELGTFPKAAHDDQVDALSQALERLREGFAFGCTVNEGEEDEWDEENGSSFASMTNMDEQRGVVQAGRQHEEKAKIGQESLAGQNLIVKKVQSSPKIVAPISSESIDDELKSLAAHIKKKAVKEEKVPEQVQHFLDWMGLAA